MRWERTWRTLDAVMMATAVLLLALPTVGRAQTLDVGGRGNHLWAARSDAQTQTVTLYHRHTDDPPGILEKVEQLHGQLVPGGIAAVGDSAYLAYRGGAVQRVEARRSDLDRTWRYSATIHRFVPGGEGGGAAVAWAAGKAGPITLIHVTRADVLARIDQGPGAQTPQQRDALNLTLGLPPGLDLESPPPSSASPSPPPRAGTPPSDAADTKAKAPSKTPTKDPSDTKAKAQADAQAREDVNADRLLVMRRGRWTPRPLPKDWPTGKPAWVVLPRPNASDPVLLTRPQGPAGRTLRIYRQVKGQWEAHQVELPTPGLMAAVAVDDQVVIAQRDPKGPGITLRCLVLGDGQARALGPVTLPGNANRPWGVVGRGKQAVAIAQKQDGSGKAKAGSGNPAARGPRPAASPEGPPKDEAASENDKPLALQTRTLDLQGTVGEVIDLTATPPSALDRPAGDYLALTAMLAMGLVMVFVLWRRDPGQAVIRVPEGQRVAEMGRRALAGAIDVVPALVGAMVIYRIGPRELLLRWPLQGAARSWVAMAPGGVAIGLVLLHTLIAELTCQRSLGKWATGLWVAAPRGGRPKAWQIVVRNALKAFDLVAWPLLILPLLSIHRQRLGDLIARTVVLSEKSSTE